MSGHIRKRELKNGGHSWQIVIERYIDQSTGKRNRIYKTIKGGTKKQAEKEMYKIINELNNKTYIAESNKLLFEWLEEWLELYVKPKVVITTYESYKMNIEKYINPNLGKIKLQSLKTTDIQKFYNKLKVEPSKIKKKPLSNRSIRYIHTNLNAALQQAVKLDMIKKNPASAVVVPKKKKYNAKIFNEDEVKKLLKIVEGTDMEIPMALEIGLGLRRGELLALSWNDVNFDSNTINVRCSLVYLNKKFIFKEPKTESSIRTIEVPLNIIKLLKNHQLEQKKTKLKDNTFHNKYNLVVCKSDGTPYIPHSFTRKFTRLLDRYNMKKIRFHDLRHTNASLMVKYDINAKVAQQRLGHSSITTTMDIYTHVYSEIEKDAAQKINKGIFSAI